MERENLQRIVGMLEALACVSDLKVSNVLYQALEILYQELEVDDLQKLEGKEDK